tara:strand:+ start:70 stop:246 length:177 start_codon:yes stop_codon:yes gene_type:complete
MFDLLALRILKNQLIHFFFSSENKFNLYTYCIEKLYIYDSPTEKVPEYLDKVNTNRGC